MKIKLPHLLAIDANDGGNTIQQLSLPAQIIEATVSNYTGTHITGQIVKQESEDNGEILVMVGRQKPPDWFAKVLLVTQKVDASAAAVDVSLAKWMRHPLAHGVANHKQHATSAFQSWQRAFSYIEEKLPGVRGLRAPQIGAIHAVHAHWSTTKTPATIVMPTGLGKTETMLSVLVSTPCDNVLVIVPTDALRIQIAEKFLTLGVLKEENWGILAHTALYPVVGVLRRKPKNLKQLDHIFESCNVVVTTSHIACQCDTVLQERMASHCRFLFIDEAHHAEAPTWKKFKEYFGHASILQFTATPFREDGKPIDGTIIYKYPLKKAQEDGYFRPIHFKPVYEFNPALSDKAVADMAIEQLRIAPKNHILMARVGGVDQARKVFQIYQKYTEFGPLELHSGIKSQRDRREIREKLLSGKSRVVVCVDMLGEGFDLPELKLAAFHDIRKSLPVTLQLAGRFIRSRPDLGDAVFVANLANVDVRDELRKLYSQDPDWNALLPELSDEFIQEQIDIKEFLSGFHYFPDDIPLKALRPANSTVIYRTKCKIWQPENFVEGVSGLDKCSRLHYSINHQTNTLVIITAQKAPVIWAEVQEVFTWDWNLYVLFWDAERHLLFINNSSNEGIFKSLAQSVAGDDVQIIDGKTVFKCFAGVNRLRFQNVGLTEQYGRLIRYTGRMGADVESGLSEAQKQHTQRTVLFGVGYEKGSKASFGASRRGRIWSSRRARLDSLVEWFKDIGEKILDESLDVDKVLGGTLEAKIVSNRPNKMPIAIDWPEEVYKDSELAYSIITDDGNEMGIYEMGIELLKPDEESVLAFTVFSDKEKIQLSLKFTEQSAQQDYRFTILGGRQAWIRHTARQVPLEEYFYQNPPTIWFVDGSSLEGNRYTELKHGYPPYDKNKIQDWDWAGIDLTKESQGLERESDSIQFKVISELVAEGHYQIIFDDDGAGECADVVAIRLNDQANDQSIEVDLYHCKYTEKSPGQRIDDLYVVCGQAQKSVCWLRSDEKKTDLFSHLLRREPKRIKDQMATRFQVGDQTLLIQLREMSRIRQVRLRIVIVQPGLQKSKATVEQLVLLSVTENYLLETYQVPFGVIAST